MRKVDEHTQLVHQFDPTLALFCEPVIAPLGKHAATETVSLHVGGLQNAKADPLQNAQEFHVLLHHHGVLGTEDDRQLALRTRILDVAH